MTERPDRNLAMELVRVTEAAALAAGRWIGRGDKEYVFVTSYTDRVPSADDRPPGWIARDLAKKILAELGLY